MDKETEFLDCIKAVKTVEEFLLTKAISCTNTLWKDRDGNGFSTDIGYFFEGLEMFKKYLTERLDEQIDKDRPSWKWLDRNGGDATCSKCRFRIHGVYDDDNFDKYCRHCGAKMEL